MSAHWYFGNMGDANGISVQSFGNRTIITLPDNMTIVATGGSVSFTAAPNRVSGSQNRSRRGRNRPGPRGPVHAHNNRNNRNNSNCNNHQNPPHNNERQERGGRRRRHQNRSQQNRGAPRAIEARPAHFNATAVAHAQALAPVDINTAGTTMASLPDSVPAGAGVVVGTDGDWNGNENDTYEPTYDPYRGPTEEAETPALNVAHAQEPAYYHPKQEGDDWRIVTTSGYDAGLDFDVSEEFLAERGASVATNLMDFTENESTETL